MSAQQRTRKPDLRISYGKALEALAAEFASFGLSYPRARARRLLMALLTDRQRAAL